MAGAAHEPNGVLVLDRRGPEGTRQPAVSNMHRMGAVPDRQGGDLTIRDHTYDCTVEDNIPPAIAVQHALPGRGT